MAFIYKKADEKNPGLVRWYAVIKAKNVRVRVSLRLAADGNKRAAQKRADELQYEADHGALSPGSLSWLGRSAARVEAAMRGEAGARPPATWAEAVALYEGGTAPPPSPVTAQTRALALRRFAAWADAHGHSGSSDFTAVSRAYVAHQQARGLKANTVLSGTVANLAPMGDWLRGMGLAEFDRTLLARSAEKAPHPTVEVPPHASDMLALRHLRDRRHDDPRHWSAWRLAALVRGLGCRPSSAINLGWPGVDLTPGSERVTVMGKGRQHQAPVLWEWLREALHEMRSRAGDSPLVCTTPSGKPFNCQGYPSDQVTLCLPPGCESWKLKKAQKLAIMQMLRCGWPAHVVARWTGHSLSMQERHYVEDDTYLAARPDYGEFGALSDQGRRTLGSR